MRIWLINTSEPLPIDDENVRLRRVGLLANFLVERGHEVLWWTSTFDHWHKHHRFSTDTTVDLGDRYRLRLLRAAGYRRNISLSRLWNHHRIGRKFRLLSRTEPPPDAILCSLPTLDTSVEAVKYGRETGVPVVLDVRDLWPDVFVETTPRWARGAMRQALRPMFNMARNACAGAFAISSNSPAFVDWGLRCGGRSRTEYDRDFPFGYLAHVPNDENISEAEKFWEELEVGTRRQVPIVCFFGAIGHHFNLKTVIQAARRLQHKRDVQFVICGVGDRLDFYRKMADDCRNVVFPGWVNTPKIWTLMKMSSFALAPYVSNTNFEDNFTNKPIEYLSAGLPILTSLKRGALSELLANHECGVSYEDDSQKLEEIILSLCCSTSQRNEMARNALRLFQARFTASEVYGKMVDYLVQVGQCTSGDRRSVLTQHLPAATTSSTTSTAVRRAKPR